MEMTWPERGRDMNSTQDVYKEKVRELENSLKCQSQTGSDVVELNDCNPTQTRNNSWWEWLMGVATACIPWTNL